ncbi:HEPN domain-containing protein [Pseudoalteromonas prydzensis]|uniref:HEPN domain-containing protein n=1 Tax=Pseudoalteromonas prydzensis TaxID=182141 RepID=UPI0007E50618|nr:HEPN domain-containing protein [Pseudoalteromonas prydzensis]MBE0378323.1 hypothetical protein [Pseudoalteromonas prydzensis ACAM 620]
MEAYQKDIVSLIDVCRKDEDFLKMVSPLIEWRSMVVSYGVAKKPLKLMDTLLARYPELLNRLWGTSTSSTTISPFDVAKWLCIKANDVGAQQAFQYFLDFTANHTAPLHLISLVEGVYPGQTYYFDNDTYICGFDALPVGVKYRMNADWYDISRDYPGARPAFIVTTVKQNVLNEHEDDDVDCDEGRALDEILNSHTLKTNFLSLFTKECGAVITRNRMLFDDTVPCSGFIDANILSTLQLLRPLHNEDVYFDEKDTLMKVFGHYSALNANTKGAVELALKRKTSSMNAHDLVDRAVDLGMCAESILTQSESTDQLSLQVRLLGAKLSSDGYKEREENYNYLKAFYKIRSSAVHNAKVRDVVKVRDVGTEVPSRDVLDKASHILSSCILKVIDLGGLNDFEKELYMLK